MSLKTLAFAAALALAANGAQAGLVPYGVVASFQASGGVGPQSPLTLGPDGLLYGLATYTGAVGSGVGEVFRVESDGSLTLVHAFAADGSEGMQPQLDRLLLASDGWFYGAAIYGGGTGGLGTLFRVATDGRFEVLHVFTAADGTGFPTGALAEGADHAIYGTTSGAAAGAKDFGAAFRLVPGSAPSWLHRFADGTDGAYPQGGLVAGADGSFYGTSSADGAQEGGVLFSLTAAGAYRALHAFACRTEGCWVHAPLLAAADGHLYGAAFDGGAGGGGTVFQVDGADVHVLHAFSSTDKAGQYPDALVQDASGSLFGATQVGGANKVGTVFELNGKGRVTVLHAFGHTFDDAANPAAGLTIGADAALYGTSFYGGTLNLGAVYRLVPN